MKPVYFFIVLSLILTGCSSKSSHNEEELIAIAEFRQALRKRPVIIIDAGHGGDDRGAHSDKPPKYEEKSLALTTAKMLNIDLQKMGYKTQMIRKEDYFVPLKQRSAIANELHPKVFVSVHYNSAPSKKASGIEVFYFDSDKDRVRSERSKKLAQGVLDRVIGATSAKSRGVKHGNYSVIRETKMPAILVECGFLTNDAECKRIQNPDYMKRLARGIAEGVHQYLKKK